MKNEKSLKQLLDSPVAYPEKEMQHVLQRKINRANKGGRMRPVLLSPEEAESAYVVIHDLSERVIALEKENTHLSLFGYQRNHI